MEIIMPSVEVEDFDSIKMMKNIEKAGRKCYKSEDKITEDSADKFIANIIKRGHETVIEHEKITATIICDRGVSHEIVRHRLASYSQESTRYVNYSKKGIQFVLPCWFKSVVPGIYKIDPNDDRKDNVRFYGDNVQEVLSDIYEDSTELSWILSMLNAEQTYNKLIEEGWSPQQARSVLPNSLKTEIVATMNLRELRHFFKLRCSKAAHPQMREVANLYLDQVKDKLPVIFGDI